MSNSPSASEFELIEALLAPLQPIQAKVGPGDDGAVLDWAGGQVVLASDLTVEDVHFKRSTSSLEDIGFKAAAVTLSDLAAMGAEPIAMTVDITIPQGDLEGFRQLGQGLRAACHPWRCSVVGGDLSRGPCLLISTTALGRLEHRPLLRSGAQPGDRLLVTGQLGDSAGGLLSFQHSLVGFETLKLRHRRPQPRIDCGKRLGKIEGVHAAIDVSDGLLQDLGHLCKKSTLSARIQLESLPRSQEMESLAKRIGQDPLQIAATGGEDFELLLAVSPDVASELCQDLSFPVSLTYIGFFLPGSVHRVQIWKEQKNVSELLPWSQWQAGHDHFA